jgi:N-formylglutamate deformylase
VIADLYSFRRGSTPLLISVPHAGRCLPETIANILSGEALALADTDWYVDELYDFAAATGAGMLIANYSRCVVDLNRSSEDTPLYSGAPTSACIPTHTFAGVALYAGRIPSAMEKAERLREYWQPYHDQIQEELLRLRALHGFALLLDAHSIAGEIPTLFPGRLPSLNLGTADGLCCDRSSEELFSAWAEGSGYDWVINGRFKGGFITRHFGRPAEHWHAMQLEINQSTYLREQSAAAKTPPKNPEGWNALQLELQKLVARLVKHKPA